MSMPWAEQAKAHWKEHRPRMYAELQKAGTLDEQAEKAAAQTREELYSAIEDGMDYYDAWEMLRERYLFLPAEKMCRCSERTRTVTTPSSPHFSRVVS